MIQSRIVAPTYVDALEALCLELAHCCSAEVLIESDGMGYFASLKTIDKPVSEYTPRDMARAMRRHANPQPYDIILRPWPAWMYVGCDRGERSSAM